MAHDLTDGEGGWPVGCVTTDPRCDDVELWVTIKENSSIRIQKGQEYYRDANCVIPGEIVIAPQPFGLGSK